MTLWSPLLLDGLSLVSVRARWARRLFGPDGHADSWEWTRRISFLAMHVKAIFNTTDDEWACTRHMLCAHRTFYYEVIFPTPSSNPATHPASPPTSQPLNQVSSSITSPSNLASLYCSQVKRKIAERHGYEPGNPQHPGHGRSGHRRSLCGGSSSTRTRPTALVPPHTISLQMQPRRNMQGARASG